MLSHSQLWRGAACVGQNSPNIWNVFPDVLSALFQPWARCFRYWIYLWCPVSASSFFLPLNIFTRAHCLLLKEIPICLMLGNLLCPTFCLTFASSLPVTWCRSRGELCVIPWKWCHGLPISHMAMEMRWPSGASFCSCWVSPSTVLIRMMVTLSLYL